MRFRVECRYHIASLPRSLLREVVPRALLVPGFLQKALSACMLLTALTIAQSAWADQAEWNDQAKSESDAYQMYSWKQVPCTNSCKFETETCVKGRCLPFVNIAATYTNNGGTSIPGGIPYSHFESLVKKAMRRWTTDQVKSCETKNEIGGFNISSTPKSAQAMDHSESDSMNFVSFVEGDDWTLTNMTLGVTTTWRYVSTGTIFDADIAINGNVTWFEGPANGNRNSFSLESVLTHEAGHFFGVHHTTYRGSALMHPITMAGTYRITLDLADEEDICGLYPPKHPQFAQSCRSQTDCGSNLTCLPMQAGNRRQICTLTCAAADAGCPSSNYQCLTLQGAPGCFLPSRPKDYCLPCRTGADCESGICWADSYGAKYCSFSCVRNSDCNDGDRCSDTTYKLGEDEILACMNISFGTCSGPCENDAQCRNGSQCKSGRCAQPSRLGQDCSGIRFCAAGLICSDAGGAKSPTCRSCCGGTCPVGAAKSCTGSCVADSMSDAQVCLPIVRETTVPKGDAPPSPTPTDNPTGPPSTPSPGCGCASTGPESSLWLLAVLPWIAWRRRYSL